MTPRSSASTWEPSGKTKARYAPHRASEHRSGALSFSLLPSLGSRGEFGLEKCAPAQTFSAASPSACAPSPMRPAKLASRALLQAKFAVTQMSMQSTSIRPTLCGVSCALRVLQAAKHSARSAPKCGRNCLSWRAIRRTASAPRVKKKGNRRGPPAEAEGPRRKCGDLAVADALPGVVVLGLEYTNGGFRRVTVLVEGDRSRVPVVVDLLTL